MIERQKIQNIDWILIGLLIINSLIGVVVIYSSSRYLAGHFFLRQLIWMIVSLGVLFILLTVDYRVLVDLSIYLYILFLFLLGGNLIFGKLIAGTKSWIRLPFFQIQPSEFMKLLIILMMARLFYKNRNVFIKFRKGMAAILIAVVPFGLVALQPDPGTALSYLLILLGAFILAGMNKKMIIFLLVGSVCFGLFAWNFCLKDYQKDRLTAVVFPGNDPLGSGYQIIQSKIAIGSGGFLGKGFEKGTQSQLRFLPARHTDFIFAVIGEEFGFLGILFALMSYILLITRILKSVKETIDRAGAYIIFLVAVLISVQFFINVFMTVGLFPVIGIPLPFLSYGGSSLLANTMAVALVLNVKMRRFVNV